MHNDNALIHKSFSGSGNPPSQRLSYTSPALRCYGEVKHMTEGRSGGGRDADNTMTKMSDRNTKENIVKIGVHPLGVGLYLFDYKAEYRDEGGHGRQLGVMADEVEAVRPAAVSLHANGYKLVDYSKLH